MIEKFNGIIYFIIFLIHFAGVGLYAYQLLGNTAKFREKFAIDVTATSTMRMLGGMLAGVFLMALYILYSFCRGWSLRLSTFRKHCKI